MGAVVHTMGSTASIERSKKQRIHFDNNDAFIYNGGIELVYRGDWSSSNQRFYGARIEGNFAKFHFFSSSTGWEVLTPDGRIYRYGTTANAQLQTDQGVIKWLLDEIEDANGNIITIDYDKVTGDEIFPKRIDYAPSGSYISFATEARNDIYPVYAGYTRVEASKRLKTITCYGAGSGQFPERRIAYNAEKYAADHRISTPG
ncbi:MAG: hypothetical protein VR64_23645 [Desulfatitalea sp. BRH_c12]|nr:MAG: hypothetical protein VR64_23645 [Desulfatitalea sp. BRH_c12]